MAYARPHPDFPKFRMKVGVMPDFSGANYVDQEKPSGIMNGTNRVFTFANLPIRQSEDVFKDGMKMVRATSAALTDGDYFVNYNVTPVTITFADNQVPQAKSVLRVSYKYMQGNQ